MMEIQLKKSKLRPWGINDSASLAIHANNIKIASFLRDAFPHPYTLEDAKWWLANIGTKSKTIWAIDIQGQAIGSIGIHQFEDVYRQTAEIGYWLSEEYWNQGILSEAIPVITHYGFSELKILRIQAGVFSNNPASAKILVKSGFTLEAIHKNAVTKGGNILDEHIYVKFRG